MMLIGGEKKRVHWEGKRGGGGLIFKYIGTDVSLAPHEYGGEKGKGVEKSSISTQEEKKKRRKERLSPSTILRFP